MSEGSTGRPAPSEELVAYLDGELGAEESRKIERLLADDPRVRIELQRLDRTWELLDGLPRAEPDPVFTRSTVEMIAVSVADQIERERSEGPSRRRRAWWLACGLLACAATAGFASGQKLSSLANERLLDDLALFEQLEAYRQTPDLDFLRQARSAALFGTVQPAAETTWASLDSREGRRQQVMSMDPRAKEQLLRKRKTFDQLSAAEHARLRALDAELSRAGDATDLRRVLAQFQQWLNQLTAAERAHLLHVPNPDQRRMEIKRKLDEEAKRLGPEDSVVFERWWEELFKRRFQPNQLRNFEQKSPEERFEAIQSQLRQQAANRRAPAWARLPSPEDFNRLRQDLSEKARAQWDQANDERDKRQLLRIWVMDTFHLRPAARGPVAGVAGITDEQLREFFTQLPDLDRDRLLGLPPEEMFRRLRQRYETGQREKSRRDRKAKPGKNSEKSAGPE